MNNTGNKYYNVSLKEYIENSLRILIDFEIFLTEEEEKEFRALPTKEAVDRHRMNYIKKKLEVGQDD